MDMDVDLDTHICLKCQTTIIGLDNYIVHKRTQCPMMMAKFTSESVKLNTNEEGTVTVVTTVVNMDESLPEEQSQPSAALSDVAPADLAPSQNEHLRPDDFFLSLELQSNKAGERKCEPCKADGTAAVDNPGADAVIAFSSDMSSPQLSTEEMVTCQVVDDKMHEVNPYDVNEVEEEDSDDNWPPEGHTGGKWKPGMRPGTPRWRAMGSRRGRKPKASCYTRVKKAKEKCWSTDTGDHLRSVEDTVIEQNDKLWHCTPCNLTFTTESKLVRHLASPEHWEQGKTHPVHEQLILSHCQSLARFSPFQCYVCSFYFNRYEDFMEHWSKPQELHREHLEIHKGFRCSICNLECWTIDEIRIHLEVIDHRRSISNSNPLVVKNANGFRCKQCDWSTTRNTSLQSHLKGRHHKLMALTCIVCMTSFPDQESLTGHLATDQHRSNCHPCSSCPFLGKSLVDLANHTAMLHCPARKEAGVAVHQDSDYSQSAEGAVAKLRTEENKFVEEEVVTNKDDRPRRLCQIRGRRRHCLYCDKVVTHHVELKTHIRTEHPENTFHCQPCCVSFICESQFKKHENTGLHKCCMSDISSGQLLEGDVEFYCRQCDFRSLTQVGILFHQAMHIGPSPLSRANRTSDDEDDDEDDVGGETEDDVDGTEDKTETENERAPENGVVEVEAKYLERSVGADDYDDKNDNSSSSKENNGSKQARRKEHKKYCCPVCQKTFTWIRLRVHLNKHTGDKPFVCAMCGTAYAQKSSLWSHIRSQHKEKVFACPHCSFRASRHHKLKVHLEIHKERERNFICEICGAGFFRRYALIHHEKLHNGEKNQKCNFPGCNKSFRCPSELVYHMRIHTGECPFLCDTCGYSAKTRHQLTKHERTHNGIRPFQCPHCSYSASLSPQLKRHMRIHSGSKPYSCPHCKYTCNTQENLRKHVLKSKKHRGLNVYTCPRCNFGCDWAKDMKEHMMDKHGDLAKSFDETSPAFSSTLTGVYNGECDKKLVGNPPIPYVPRTEKRTVQQLSTTNKDLPQPAEELLSYDSENTQSEFDLQVPSPGDNMDDSSVVIVTSTACEPQLEIAAVESVKWIKVDNSKDKVVKKRHVKSVRTKIEVPKKRIRRAVVQTPPPLDSEEDERAELEQQVTALQQEEEKDNEQLFQLLHGDLAERQESEEIALYTIELPVAPQEDGDEKAVSKDEEETEEVLSTVVSDENETQEQLQNAIFIPLSSVLSAAPSADGRTLTFIQNPNDQIMVNTPVDENEQQTLAFIQNPEGDSIMTAEGQDGETVIFYTCMPIST